MTFRFGNDETLETRTLAILPVGIGGVNRVLHVHVVPGGVRAVVTSEQSQHLLLPLTSFGPQRHKIPAEIQLRISSDERAIYRAACDSSRQNKIHSWIASAPDHREPETGSTDTDSLHGTDGEEKNPAILRETAGKTERDDG